MKNILMLGKEYGEREIEALVKFDNHMSEIFIQRIIDGGVTVRDIEEERNRYIANANEEESEIIAHYVNASILNNHKPLLGMLVAIPCIILTSLISIFVIKLILNILIAGMLTLQTKILLDKRAYKKIMNLIKEGTMK